MVDYPSSSVHIRAIQPLSSAVNVRHAEAVWKSLNTYSGDLAHSLRGKSGLSYGHHHQFSHQPGLSFVDLSLQVDGENVVSVIQRVEAEMAHRRQAGLEQFEWKVGQLQVHRESMMRAFHASADTLWWSWRLHLGFFTDADVASVDSLAWDAEQVEYALQDMTSIERRTWLLVGDYSMIGPSLQAAGIEVDAVWAPESL